MTVTHSSHEKNQPRDPKIFVVKEDETNMFSKEMAESAEVSDREGTMELAHIAHSEEDIKKTEDSPPNEEMPVRLTTTMAKEELGNQLSSL